MQTAYTDNEISSILKAKELFKLPLEELSHELENMDSGCENAHWMTPCSASPDVLPFSEDVLCNQLKELTLTHTNGNGQSLL